MVWPEYSRPLIAFMTFQKASRCSCRFSRLANGSNKVSVADLLELPELSGNVFIPSIFQMYASRDGYLSLQDFTSAIEKLGQLYTGDDRAECEAPLHHEHHQFHVCVNICDIGGGF